MKYKLQFCPNPEVIKFHFQKRLCFGTTLFDSPKAKLKIWEGNDCIEQEPPTYIKRLWEVPGLVSISIQNYSIQLQKGEAFDWNDMLERITAILNLELFPDSEPEQLGMSDRPGPDLTKKLRDNGCDV